MGIKAKLIASIVAISAIDLLKRLMGIGAEAGGAGDRALPWAR